MASSSSSLRARAEASPPPSPSSLPRRALLLAGSMAGLGSVAASALGSGAAAAAAAAASASAASASAATVDAAAAPTGRRPPLGSGGGGVENDPGAVEAFDIDPRTGLTRLRYSPTGYRTFLWTPPPDALLSPASDGGGGRAAIKINWAAAGPVGGAPVLLVHGYGASAYHWRYTLPALAQQGYRAYACDLAGFGWSERSTALAYAQGRAWARQLAAFVEGVVLPEQQQRAATNKATRVAIAGNSLGGYASMAAAATRPDLFRAVALVNSAGPLEEQQSAPSGGGGGAASAAAAAAAAAARERARRSAEEVAFWADGDVYSALDARQRRLEAEAEREAQAAPLAALARRAFGGAARGAKRAALFLAFQRAKQPEQIRSVLSMVYASPEPLDDDLVASIVAPTSDPRSGEVFAMINGLGAVGRPVPPPQLTVDALALALRRADVPVALVWGERDPWMTPRRAEQILALAPGARYYGLASAGHCPHDDAPAETTAALVDFFSL
jgi:pimeloyl-ACP methyl ester carboxylesterase